MKLVAHSSSAAARKGNDGGRNLRKALARPGMLAMAMFATVAGCVYWAGAQNARNSAQMAVPTGSYGKVADIRDIPELMNAYGQRKAAEFASKTPGGLKVSAGYKLSGSNLVEVDLTPNSPSDDREPVFSPNGDYIAFASTGADKNKDGFIDSVNAEKKYHIWIMNRDGTDQRRVSGLFADRTRDQRRPSWSPDGNRIVCEDSSVPATDGSSDPQLQILKPFSDSDPGTVGDQPEQPLQITFSHGPKSHPAWSPSGSAITFASTWSLDAKTPVNTSQYDLFSIDPDGSANSLVRITGGSVDPSGQTTDDWMPTYSPVNGNAIYFSSNRDNTQKLSKGRRIWVISGTGTDLQCITDPTARYDYKGNLVGSVDDVDDCPSISRASGFQNETLAFQTNTKADASDVLPGEKDNNIWQMPVDSTTLIPTSTEPAEAKLLVSNYNGDEVESYNPLNINSGAAIQPVSPDLSITGVAPPLNSPEGVAITSTRHVYISNRGNNKVERYTIDDGLPAGVTIFAADPTATVGGTLKSPSGLVFDGFYLYVSAGVGTTTLYRYDVFGSPAGYNPQNLASGVFGHGEDDPGRPTNGAEGLAFGPDLDGDGQEDLYQSEYLDSKINVYSKVTGLFIKTVVLKGDNGLNIPTGIAFNKAQTRMYVCSSGTSEVFQYDTSTMVAGTATFLQKFGGDPAGMSKPEGIRVADLENDGSEQVYVSNYGGQGFGNTILRFNEDGSVNPNPAAVNTPTSAVWMKSLELEGAGYFDFDDLAKAGPPGNATPTPIPGTEPPIEGATGFSLLVTSAISSPDRLVESGLTGSNATEDKAADINPAFARSVGSSRLTSQLAFASGRKAAPYPGSPSDPNPVIVNPFGGDELDGTGTKIRPAPPNDIWTTSTRDTTPPALVPQGVGNEQYAPVIAPRDNAGLSYSAPQTPLGGLRAGGDLRVAFVLNETESGLSSDLLDKAVTVSFRDPKKPTWTSFTTPVNDAISVQTSHEELPKFAPGFTDLPLNVYDDGPCIDDGSGGCTAAGGHERQASAVKGDGLWYCESDPKTAPVKTPSLAGDYYIDISVHDKAGNSFLFDRVWGFTTTTFVPVSTPVPHDLYVSDYAVGQSFPFYLTGDQRFLTMMPTESYMLTNPGGVAFDKTGIAAQSTPTTWSNVDVWRILCRGPVPQSILDGYEPSPTKQIDPKEVTDGKPGPFKDLKRSVAVAKQCVIWHAPYAGTAFSGPGTIQDPDTQDRLTTFLDGGGRLFLTGREIIFTLSNQGKVSNNFLRSELQSDWNGEAMANNIAAEAGAFTNYPGTRLPVPALYNNLQLPGNDRPNSVNTYFDACFNHNPYFASAAQYTDAQGVTWFGNPVSNQFDLMGEGTGDASSKVTEAYSFGGTPVGKRIERTRASGVQSRAVFFSFGMEAVNRAFYLNKGFPMSVDVRFYIAQNIRKYFLTGGISGNVINDKTNLPVPNFLVKATGADVYYARTDSKGEYEFVGLPSGSYVVQPVYDPAVDPNDKFTGGTPLIDPGVVGGQTDTDYNFRVVLPEPASVTGRATQSNSTPNNRGDDTNLPNTPILIRSVDQSSIFTGGGHYAALAMTNASGVFSFSGVPSGFDMEIVLNPDVADIPAESGLRPSYQANIYGGPNPAYGKRTIPDKKRPTVINLPAGNPFVVNDPKVDNEVDIASDNGVPIVVPLGPSVSGIITLRGKALEGATVSLTPTSGGVTPSPQTTDATGAYLFADVKPGKYTLKATAIVDDVSVSGSKTITVKQGSAFTAPTLDLFLAQVGGTVLLNGQPFKSIVVTLQSSSGGALTFTRTSTTGAKGKYLLTNVPAGNYKLVAAGSGYSGFADITVTATADLVQDIVIARRGVYGKVFLNGTLVKGAAVELVDTSGNSLTPGVTTTTDDTGTYGFESVTSGSYKVKGSIYGDSALVGPVTATTSGTQAPDIQLYVSRITGRVLFEDKTTAAGVKVEAFKNGGSVGVTSTDENGAYSFRLLPAGTYTLNASFGNSGGQASATLVRSKGPVTAPDIILVQVKNDSTTFSKTGYYTVTLPYEDTNSPTTNNSGVTPATALVKDVFTLPMFDTSTGAQNFMLQRFNTTTRQYVTLSSTDSVKRGEGYLLRVMREQAAGAPQLRMTLPGTGIALKPLGATIKTFTLLLRRNISVTNDPNNGVNLVGSGLKPSLGSASLLVFYKGPSDAQAKDHTLTQAIADGILAGGLTYIDPASGATVAQSSGVMDPYVGYYLRTNYDNVKVTLTAP